MKKKQVDVNEIPDTAMAEEWLTPDIFMWDKRKWRVMPDCSIIEVKYCGRSLRGQRL